MAAKRLIVNADDFNTDEARNRGILQAARAGIVTSTSVIVNLPMNDQVLADLHTTFGPRVGLHLNLTKGSPLVSGARTLTGRDGSFLSKTAIWRNALLGRVDLHEVEAEFAAQLETAMRFRIPVDHLDGNNHVHIFPGIAAVTAKLANRFGIPSIRLPHEPFRHTRQTVQSGAGKKFLIGRLARRARPIFARHGLRFTDHFAGIQFPRVAKLDSLRAFLASLPEGTTELMCHPGFPNPSANPFSSREREEEMQALMHPAVRDDIRRLAIHLVSFGELTR
jgi:predicted glycoside hydrolase/deacetylase ChbG (UPF0249 family)